MLSFDKIQDPHARKVLYRTFKRSSFSLLVACYLIPLVLTYWIPKAGAWIVLFSTLLYAYLSAYIFTLYPDVNKSPGITKKILILMSAVSVLCAVLGAVSQTYFDVTGVDYADTRVYYVTNQISSKNGTSFDSIQSQVGKQTFTSYAFIGILFSGGIVPCLGLIMSGTLIVLSGRIRRACKVYAGELSEPQVVVYTQDEGSVKVNYENRVLKLGELDVELDDILLQLMKNPGGVLCNGYNVMSMDLRKGELPGGFF